MDRDDRSESSAERERETKRARKSGQAACDACRLRRVKCEPAEAADESGPCKNCVKHDVCCTRQQTSRSPYGRSGKRLDQARAIFGSNQENASQTPAPFVVPSLGASTSMNSSLDDDAAFTVDSAEARLGLAQHEVAIANALVHTYREHLLGPNVFKPDFDDFLDRFEASGRRFAALTTDDKVSCMLVVAMAARISDLPVIAGATSPSIKRVKQGVPGSPNDLLACGQTRDAVCRSFEKRARHLVERTYFRRECCFESIMGLLALQRIDDTDDPLTAHPRLYSSAAIEQLRTLVQKRERTKQELFLLHGHLMRNLVLEDSLKGIGSGRTLQISDDDLATLYPRALTLSVQEGIQRMQHGSTWDLICTLIDMIIIIARRIRAQLASPMALHRNTPPSATWFTQQRTSLQMLLQRLKAVQRQQRAGDQEFHKIQSLRSTEMGLTYLSSMLYRHGVRYLETMADDDDERKIELSGIMEELRGLCYTSLIDFADTARLLHEDKMVFSKNSMWGPMSMLARWLLELPCLEEGGPAHFTLERKIECLDSYLVCLYTLTYSWPASARDLPVIEAGVRALKERLRPSENMDWLVTLPMPTPSTSAAIMDSLFAPASSAAADVEGLMGYLCEENLV